MFRNDKRINQTRGFITFINTSTSKMGTPTYVKQILTDLEGERDRNTIVVEVFHILLTSMNTSSRQKSIRKRQHQTTY